MQVFQKRIISTTPGSEDTLYHYCVLRGDLALVDLRHTKCSDFQLNYLTVLNYLEKNKLPMSALGTARLVEYDHNEAPEKKQVYTLPDLVAKMVNAFLAWPLPKTVRPDGCVMNPEYQSYLARDSISLSGTHLLNADEAENMIRFILNSVNVTDIISEGDVPVSEAKSYVIYSCSEEKRTGAGYWNLIEGWVQKDNVNHFVDSVFPSGFLVPASCGNDAVLVPSNFRSWFDLKLPGSYVADDTADRTLFSNIDIKFEDVKPVGNDSEIRKFLGEWSSLINSKQEIIYLDDKYVIKADKSGCIYELVDNYQPKKLNISINFDDDHLSIPIMYVLIDRFQALNNNVSTEEDRKDVTMRLDVIKHLIYALSILENKRVVDERN